MSGLHTWSGLVVGWLLFAIAFTGTLTVFRSEFNGWMRPEITASASPASAIEAGVSWLRRAHPDSRYWFLTAPDERLGATLAVFEDRAAPGGYRDAALDPVTGSADGIRDTRAGEFLYRFHFELQLPYPWGRILASAAGMLMLVALLSGIIIHARIFKDFFTFRSGKGKRSWLDAHNALGVLALPFHLMISLTGVLTLVTLTLPWGVVATYGSDLEQAYRDISPGFVSRPPAGKPGALAPIAPMLDEAQRFFGQGRIGRVSIANPSDAHATVTIASNDGDQLGYAARTISFDGTSGHVIARHVENRPARLTYDVLYGLHMGRFADWASHWLYFLCGMALTATIATGLVLWMEARPGRNGFGHRLVARLNIGTIAGLPIGTLAFLWANRLIPADLPGRADGEIAAFFWAWGAAILYAFLRAPRRAWVELLSLAALLAAALPFLSFALTGRGLWRAAMGHDGLFLGFDLGCFAFAALFLLTARRVSSHRGPVARKRRPLPA